MEVRTAQVAIIGAILGGPSMKSSHFHVIFSSCLTFVPISNIARATSMKSRKTPAGRGQPVKSWIRTPCCMLGTAHPPVTSMRQRSVERQHPITHPKLQAGYRVVTYKCHAAYLL